VTPVSDIAAAIIDDDAAVRDSLCFLLEVAGHRVRAYASAAAFLAETGVSPGCLIIDHHMPHMSGLELVARLRAEGVRMRIMLITGSVSPAIRARAAELGIARVLEKPPVEDELLAFIGGDG
jgi:two-component system response regulator FixJ